MSCLTFSFFFFFFFFFERDGVGWGQKHHPHIHYHHYHHLHHHQQHHHHHRHRHHHQQRHSYQYKKFCYHRWWLYLNLAMEPRIRFECERLLSVTLLPKSTTIIIRRSTQYTIGIIFVDTLYHRYFKKC